jgi:hypothetical protein
VKEQTDCRVLPVSVVHVAGDDKEGNLEFDGLRDEIVECIAAGGGHQGGQFGVYCSQAHERASQVQICSMDK